MNTQEASAIIDGAISKMDLLIVENQRLADALAFYAKSESYCKIFAPHINQYDPRTFAPVLQDDGSIARQALAKRTPKP